MITYTCPQCKISSERSICSKCGGRTDVESHLYWCSTCKVPLYARICENCGQEGIEFAADIRPVFPEERLLVEILLGKPLAFIDRSVWASAGDRYYVDGKKIIFSTIKHSGADADKVRHQWNEWSPCNSYRAFDRYKENFIKANQTRLDYYTLAMARFDKINQQIRREAKAWMQKNVLGYARKIYNLPVVDAIRLQSTLEKVPNCLDADDLNTVEEYRTMVAERIKLARIEAIELMFKELDMDEKTRCLDGLKKIMDKGLKRVSILIYMMNL